MKDRLDFLRGSVLARVDEYDKVPSDVLLRELQIYRHLARQDFDKLLAGEDKTNDLLSLSYGDVIMYDQLRPMFLYAESMVAADPLFEETRGYNLSQFDKYMAQQLPEYDETSFAAHEGQWRERVRGSMRYMLEVAPLVDSGFLTLHPLSLLSEPSDPPPLWYSDCEFKDLLPEDNTPDTSNSEGSDGLSK